MCLDDLPPWCFLRRSHFIDTAFHEESPFILRIIFPIQDFSKPADRFRKRHIFARCTGKGFGDRERLREEPLDLASSLDKLFIFVRKLFNAEDGDNILQVFIALQDATSFIRHAVVFLADYLWCQCGRARLKRINGWIDTQ